MPLFSYSGRDAQGARVSGTLEGEHVQAVAMRLLRSGVQPLTIAPHRGADDSVKTLARRLGFGRPSTADLLLFTRQLHTIVRAGLPLLGGLRSLAATTSNPVLRETLEDVLRGLEAGRELSACLARHPDVFPPLYIGIVRVGEETGTLEAALLRLGEYLRADKELNDAIRTALRYPAIVIVAIVLAVSVITLFVLPRFAPLFALLGDDVPWATRAIIATAQFTREQWPWVAGAVLLGGFAARRALRTRDGKRAWDRLQLRTPIIGRIVHEASLGRIVRALAMCVAAGLPVIQALATIARAAGNDVMSEGVLRVRDSVERGEPLSRAMAHSRMYPPLVLQMVSVGEDTGALADMLNEVGDYYQREVDHTVKSLTSLIEPILIVAVGGIVLVLALGVFLPMWDLATKVSAMQ